MIKNDIPPDEAEKRLEAERAFAIEQNDKNRAHQLELARLQASRPTKLDPWPAIKSIAYAPCYGFALLGVVLLAIFKRPIPQVLVDWLNS